MKSCQYFSLMSITLLSIAFVRYANARQITNEQVIHNLHAKNICRDKIDTKSILK